MIGEAIYEALAGFLMSAKREREWIAERHPNRAVYAPPIVRHHAPWPGSGGTSGGQRPYQPWPGGRP
jgi:hypothetical protein